jgi:hypothetical protein
MVATIFLARWLLSWPRCLVNFEIISLLNTFEIYLFFRDLLRISAGTKRYTGRLLQKLYKIMSQHITIQANTE